MLSRVEQQSDQVKQMMNGDSFFKVEVVTHWGRPQNFIDSFIQNPAQLMEFILSLFRRTQSGTRVTKQVESKGLRKRSENRNEDDLYLNTLEDQILKSLNIKRDPNDHQSAYDSKGKSNQKTPQARASRKLAENLTEGSESSNLVFDKQAMQLFQGITGADAQNFSRPKTTSGTEKSVDKKKKNVFGLDFEIPDELQQLIVMEMKQKEKKNQQQRLTTALSSNKQQQNN